MKKNTRKFPVPGVKDIILVASGKGGVGKSTVAGICLKCYLSWLFTIKIIFLKN